MFELIITIIIGSALLFLGLFIFLQQKKQYDDLVKEDKLNKKK